MAILSYKYLMISIAIIFLFHPVLTDLITEEITPDCTTLCTKTFSPHTNPEGSEERACSRGCRFYNITKFLNLPDHTNTIDGVGLSPAKNSCYQSCVDAYNETSSSTNSCKLGCDKQETLNHKSVELHDSGYHLLKPVMQVKEVVSRVFGMLRFVHTSLTYYFLSDNNKLIAVNGPVEVMVQVIDPSEENESEEVVKEINNVPIFKNQQTDNVLSERSLISSSSTTIEGLSKKVGVPPYLLIVSLVSFIVVFVYIILMLCSSLKTKDKKMKTGFAIPTHALPVKLVRPEDLTKLSLVDEEEGSLVPGLHHTVKLPVNTKI